MDDDSGNNGLLDFKLVFESDNDPVYFEIEQYADNPKMAALRTLSVFSRDEDARLDDYVPLDNSIKYKVNVLAEDQGAIPLSTTCFFFVTITDVNDNSPVFDSIEYEVTIAQDAASGSQV